MKKGRLDQSQLYEGPHSEWLREILEQLPNLQSLIVSRLPFFDHAALLALRNQNSSRRSGSTLDRLTFGLRLLIAAQCQNTTWQGLVEALDHFPNLAYLDLSNTLAARDKAVLSKLQDLQSLQVLKLRNVDLRDNDLLALTDAIGIRLRSLDVRSNHITDHGLESLLSRCFVQARAYSSFAHTQGSSNIQLDLTIEDWPLGISLPDPAVLDEFQDETYDDRLVRRLTSHVVSRLPFEDLPQSGITHLRISDNDLTAGGLAALINSRQLIVLDAGYVTFDGVFERGRSTSLPYQENPDRCRHRLAGVQKLIPILELNAQRITWLRIDHTLMTEKVPPSEDIPLQAICEIGTNDATSELEAPVPFVSELDNTQPPLYELDSREIVPKYEVGDHVDGLAIQHTGEIREALESDDSLIRRGSVFAPEAVAGPSEIEDDDQLVLNTAGLALLAQKINGINAMKNADMNLGTRNLAMVANGDIRMSIRLIEVQRRELRARHANSLRGLTPGMLPNLRVLVLTEVPCYEKTRNTVDALIHFIEDCAVEAKLAELQVRLQTNSVAKSGHVRTIQGHRTPRAIFALQRIVLEMAPAEPLSTNSQSSQPMVSPADLAHRTKSSTEDADSEAFWAASQNDFSFFDDDEECGLPAAETCATVPYSVQPEKMVLLNEVSQNVRLSTLPPNNHKTVTVDLVQELAKFRSERKMAFKNASERGITHVDGHWPGEIKIIRGHGSRGISDYHGNLSNGGIYR